jgi:hypothetical protein
MPLFYRALARVDRINRGRTREEKKWRSFTRFQNGAAVNSTAIRCAVVVGGPAGNGAKTAMRGHWDKSAGEELFAADSAKEAIALATTAHPNDDGWFTRYIPKEKGARIYANQWGVAALQ